MNIRAPKPIVERDYWIRAEYNPDSVVLREILPNEWEKAPIKDYYEIYVSHYLVNNNKFWRARFLHMRIIGLSSRKNAIEAGKSLVQSYLQGCYESYA